MKSTMKKALIAAMVMAGTATHAIAADGTVDADINATAVIERIDVSVTEFNVLDFGSVITGFTAGTVALAATNTPAAFDDGTTDDPTTGLAADYAGHAAAILATATYSTGLSDGGGNTPVAGLYAIYSSDAGSADGLDYSITLPTQIDLTAGFGAGTGTNTMTVTGISFKSSSNADPANQSMPVYATNQAHAISIGGTLNVAADQATGTYSGAATMTVAYK